MKISKTVGGEITSFPPAHNIEEIKYNVTSDIVGLMIVVPIGILVAIILTA